MLRRRESFGMSSPISMYKPQFGQYNYENRPSRLIVSNINSSSCTREILDAIYSNDIPKLLDYISLLDFTKCQFYTFSDDKIYPRYRKYIMRDFMSPIIDLIGYENNFNLFKACVDFILSKVEFPYMEFIFSESNLTDILNKLVPFHPELNKSYYTEFETYFGYLSGIGLFHPKNGDYYLDLVYCLYNFFSEPQFMFSQNTEYKKIFKYILSIVPAFKLFFSRMPISNLPFDYDYIQMAYCHGLNVHCEYISKSLPLDFWSSYTSDVLPTCDILEFLYLSGRDAMKELLRLGLNAHILLESLKPNEFSNFEEYTKLYDSNEYKVKGETNSNGGESNSNGGESNSNGSNLERRMSVFDSDCKIVELINDYDEFKFRLNTSLSKTIKSINVILDFARLSDKFPVSLRLTKSQLLKKYSVFPKNVADEVRSCLSGMLTENIVGIILSY